MAPPTDEVPHYLHPDFDPWTIKMDQIRDILIQHNVKPPTGAVRKQQLVDLFNEHIKPDVPELGETGDMIDHEDTAKFAKVRLCYLYKSYLKNASNWSRVFGKGDKTNSC
jgi:hypothetical protein